jgi:hypothetical protein
MLNTPVATIESSVIRPDSAAIPVFIGNSRCEPDPPKHAFRRTSAYSVADNIWTDRLEGVQETSTAVRSRSSNENRGRGTGPSDRTEVVGSGLPERPAHA